MIIVQQIIMINIIAILRDCCGLNSSQHLQAAKMLDDSKSSHTVEHLSEQHVHVLTLTTSWTYSKSTKHARHTMQSRDGAAFTCF